MDHILLAKSYLDNLAYKQATVHALIAIAEELRHTRNDHPQPGEN